MAFHVGVKDIIVAGGATLWLLIAASIYSIALMWQRWRFVNRVTAGLSDLLDRLRAAVAAGDMPAAVKLCQSHQGLAGPILLTALTGPTNRDERKRAIERAVLQAVSALQKGTTLLGTMATVAPFVGLFGTVIGVMRAFRDLASAAGAGPGVVAIGISEALVCTAAGLFVAIPAVAAYNYFNHRAARFGDEMGWIGDEVLDHLTEKARR
ncbi:MAG: MotA/TolQ/ExbB proton channel family protein [Elusimicrobia bacterium]|nr:MotA/TolQ/ExbB proton channel family protein [Elusimicrobiota bacterium]